VLIVVHQTGGTAGASAVPLLLADMVRSRRQQAQQGAPFSASNTLCIMDVVQPQVARLRLALRAYLQHRQGELLEQLTSASTVDIIDVGHADVRLPLTYNGVMLLGGRASPGYAPLLAALAQMCKEESGLSMNRAWLSAAQLQNEFATRVSMQLAMPDVITS
jgi:hypothetical protein